MQRLFQAWASNRLISKECCSGITLTAALYAASMKSHARIVLQTHARIILTMTLDAVSPETLIACAPSARDPRKVHSISCSLCSVFEKLDCLRVFYFGPAQGSVSEGGSASKSCILYFGCQGDEQGERWGRGVPAESS